MKSSLLALILTAALSGTAMAHSESFGITIGGSSGSTYGSLSYGYSSGRDIYVVPEYYYSPYSTVITPHRGHSHHIIVPDRGGYWRRHKYMDHDQHRSSRRHKHRGHH